ncbi:Spermatogenesis-associated protein 7-like [Exaiptasia diaphana]|nr:Spermatogenesis-associated protein 7-like [Exaiptasia diaphana]
MARNIENPKRGHLALKSSVLAPTSTSYFGQHMVLNHLNSHYRRISSAKAAVDTSAPRSMKKHIRVQDQKKRQYLKDSQGALTPGRRSKSASLENLSSRGMSPFGTSRPQSSQGLNSIPLRQSIDHSTPAPTPRDDLSAHDQYLIYQQRQQKQEQFSDARASFSPSNLPKPLVSRSRWKKIQSNVDTETNNEHLREVNADENGNIVGLETQNLSSPRDIYNGETRSARSSRLSQYPGLDCSFTSSSSAYSRRKKELQTKMWKEEQMYLEFISEVTTDVLARGIFTNRVLNKVFESHIEKRKEELDEHRMRDMIEQLKLDLNIRDS